LKITLLTPGTGHFFCGSCLRDSALAKALRARGHDVFVVPLYLPFVLEEEAPLLTNQESPRIFLGGVNMFLQQKLPWLGRLPRWLMGGLDSPRLLRWLSRKSEMTQATELGAMIVSTMRGDQGRQVAEVERLVNWLAAAERPDAICLSNGMLLGLAPRLRDALGVPIYCTLQGEAPFLDSLREPFLADAWQAMRERVGAIEGFIAVSHYYGQLMGERLDIPAERLHIVQNGIDLEDFEPAAEPASPPVLGYLARMCADKGLHTLVDAFIEVRERHPDLRLKVVGVMLPEDRRYVEACKQKLADAGALQQTSFHANVSREEKLVHLRQFSLFSVPATYGESFGLYLIEALASGVPVVQPRHASFPELIERTDGGLLCKPDDAPDLARTLDQLLSDPERMQGMGARGRLAVHEHFTVDRMAREVEAIVTGRHGVHTG